jgi:hypothetical protein
MYHASIRPDIAHIGLHLPYQVRTWRIESASLEPLSGFAQVAGSVGVMVALIFVGLQIKPNTSVLQRNEHNSTMAQRTVIRMSVARTRDIADWTTAGLYGDSAIDAADQLRLEWTLAEYAWASFRIWDRTQRRTGRLRSRVGR